MAMYNHNHYPGHIDIRFELHNQEEQKPYK